MDSIRPFLFVFCLSLSFFAINHYFGLEKIEIKKEHIAQVASAPVIEKVAESIPVVEQVPAAKASSGSFFSFFRVITDPFAKFLLFLLSSFYSFTQSWGLSIIILTIVLRLMLYPVNAWTIRTQIKTQQLGPKIAEIKERYKDDPKRAQLEQLNLYRSKGVNPIAGGCLPMLIQMPFLFAMFDLLRTTPQLEGASFIAPWIMDLGAPDVLFNLGFTIPFIGNELHLLPLLVAGSMVLQQKVSTKLPKDTSQLTDQQKQQKMMGNMMPIIFAVIFYSMPAGLNLYFLSSTLLGVVQQWFMEKRMKAKMVD